MSAASAAPSEKEPVVAEKKKAEDSREALAQPYGITKPEEDDSEHAQTMALRGTLPDVLDPTVPEVDTGNRGDLVGRETNVKPVLLSEVAAKDADERLKANRGEKSGDDLDNGPTA